MLKNLKKKIKNVYKFLSYKIFKVLNFFISDELGYLFLKKKRFVFQNNKKIFSIRNFSSTCKWRADTFLTKEIDTIEWIDTFNSKETFLDVGANIGIYSIYAAEKVKKVWSLEPESLNYAMLNLNIYDNNLSQKITALPMSLHNSMKISNLNINNLEWGEALNSFSNTKDQFGKNFIPKFYQGSYSLNLDDLINLIGNIDHVKIDVDGNEDLIISGAQKTLGNKKIKSFLIELDENLENYEFILKNIFENGYILKKKTASNFHPEIFGSTKNHIFYCG